MAGKSVKDKHACAAGCVALAIHVRAMAPYYGIPVILHTDHCAKKLTPWFEALLEANEEYFKQCGEPLFSSHMLDLSEEPDEENIAICSQYLKRMAPMKIWLEMEIGTWNCMTRWSSAEPPLIYLCSSHTLLPH